jgi:hypothetical protein
MIQTNLDHEAVRVGDEPAKRRRAPGPLAAGLIGLGLALAAGVAIFLQSGDPPPPTLRLMGGGVLRLEAVTYGTQDTLRGPAWGKLIYPLLPAGSKSWSRCEVFPALGPGDLRLDFSARGGPATGGWSTLRLTGADETGDERVLDPEMPVAFGSLPGTNEPLRWNSSLGWFPRRGRTLYLRVYEKTDVDNVPRPWRLLGEFTIANPDTGPHPTWTPPALPVSALDGPLHVELLELTAGVPPPDGEPAPEPGITGWRARFRIRDDRGAGASWYPQSLKATDATGNEWQSGSARGSLRNGIYEQWFEGPRMLHERALKLRIRFTRTADAPFRPEELWTVRDLPIPAARQSAPVDQESPFTYVTLGVERVNGPGAAVVPDLQPVVKPYPVPTVVFRYDSLPAGMSSLILRAVDDRGRPVKLQQRAATSNNTRTLEIYEVQAAPGARRFSVTLALHQSRVLEFLAPVSVASGASGSTDAR